MEPQGEGRIRLRTPNSVGDAVVARAGLIDPIRARLAGLMPKGVSLRALVIFDVDQGESTPVSLGPDSVAGAARQTDDRRNGITSIGVGEEFCFRGPRGASQWNAVVRDVRGL
jgi:hypothetical protein